MFLRNSKLSPASGISHTSRRLLKVTASASEQFEAPKNYCASVKKITPTLAMHSFYYATHPATTHWSLKQNVSSAAKRTLHFQPLSKFSNLVRLFETFKTISTTSAWFKRSITTRPLTDLTTNQRIRLQTEKGHEKLGFIKSLTENPRSYIVNINGKDYRRNPQNLLLVAEKTPSGNPPIEPAITPPSRQPTYSEALKSTPQSRH